MSTPADAAVEPPFVCRNCGRERAGETPDAAGWCAACRGALVRRATLPAWGVGAAAAALLLLGLWAAGLLASRFVVALLALVALLSFGAFKVARRAAFEVFRSRGVAPPAE